MDGLAQSVQAATNVVDRFSIVRLGHHNRRRKFFDHRIE
jgi:hypothetical protein